MTEKLDRDPWLEIFQLAIPPGSFWVTRSDPEITVMVTSAVRFMRSYENVENIVQYQLRYRIDDETETECSADPVVFSQRFRPKPLPSAEKPNPEIWISNKLIVAGFMKRFTWRGLEFVWNGRLRKYEAPGGWWVAHTRFDSYIFQRSEHERDQEAFAREMRQEARCRFLAHCGSGGDGAERDSIEGALEASLEYALRYHHGRIAELRGMCYVPEPRAT